MTTLSPATDLGHDHAGRGRLVLLDGMRGIAAMSVMMHHMQNAFHEGGPFVRAYLFVDFFFLLSGFVLTLAAENRMNAGWGAMGFMRARARRLWPTIAAGTCLGAVQMALSGHSPNLALLVVLGLLVVPDFSQRGDLFPLNAPQWSLLSELFANLVHALLLRRLTNTGLLVVAGISGAIFAGLTLYWDSVTFGFVVDGWWMALPRVLWSYTIGVWLARKWKEKSRPPLTSWWLAMALPVIVIVGLPMSPCNRGISEAIAVMALLPAALWIAALARPSSRALPWLTWLGALSFPLYAVHVPIIKLLSPLGNSVGIQALTVCSAILAALVLDRALALRWKTFRIRAVELRQA